MTDHYQDALDNEDDEIDDLFDRSNWPLDPDPDPEPDDAEPEGDFGSDERERLTNQRY